MARRSEDARLEVVCVGACEERGDPPTWLVDGRWNAEGAFEPFDVEELDCPECRDRGEPTQPDEVLADV